MIEKRCKSCDGIIDKPKDALMVVTDADDWWTSERYIHNDYLCIENFRESTIDFPDEDWTGLGFVPLVP